MIRHTQVFYKIEAENNNNIKLTTSSKTNPLGIEYVTNFTQAKTTEQLREIYKTLANACTSVDSKCGLGVFNTLVLALVDYFPDADRVTLQDRMITCAVKVTFNKLFFGANRGLLYDVLLKIGLNLFDLYDVYTEVI